MSFGFRDKERPSLRDRLRGKSGDQILEELRRKLDKDKEMFFERAPNPPSFRRVSADFRSVLTNPDISTCVRRESWL